MAIKRKTKSIKDIEEQMRRIINSTNSLSRANRAYRAGMEYIQNIRSTKTYQNAERQGAKQFAENHSHERYNSNFAQQMGQAGRKWAAGTQMSQRQYMGFNEG